MHFLYYMVAALQELEPRVARAPISLLGSLRMPVPKDLMALLLNEIADTEHDIVLVLDDYHVVDNPEIDAALAFFVERLPRAPAPRGLDAARSRGCRWRAGARSRGSPSSASTTFASRSTKPQEFLQRTMGLDLDADLVHVLESPTEGWIAGLQMAALSVRHHARTGGAEEAAQNGDRVLRRAPLHHRLPRGRGDERADAGDPGVPAQDGGAVSPVARRSATP